jgi:hypothetical protein
LISLLGSRGDREPSVSHQSKDLAMSKPKTRIASRSQPPQTTPTTIDPATLPERYILIVEGACLEPDIPNGSKVLIERDGKIAPGDLAVLYFKPDRIPPGAHNSTLKRVVMLPPYHVTSLEGAPAD